MSNSFSFNQTFKFSFAHIISFVAMLLIGYGVFMGLCYWWGGEFYKALGAALGAMAVILGGIYFMQMLKAAERDFDKKLRRERAVVGLFVLVCLGLFLPYNHFWLVHSQSDVLEAKFTGALDRGKEMFNSYDSYADTRQEAYRQHLDTLARDGIRTAYSSYGDDKTVFPILQSAAHMRLLPSNYDALRSEAEKWIDESLAGFSPFNVHLLGNLDEIERAIGNWHSTLSSYANYRLVAEADPVQGFDPSSAYFTASKQQLEEIRRVCTEASGVSIIAILTGLILFALLSLPYHLQGRHTKARTHYAFWRAIPSGQSADNTFLGGNRAKVDEDASSRRRAGSFKM